MFGQQVYWSSEERPFQAVTVKEGVLMTEDEGKEDQGYVEGLNLGSYEALFDSFCLTFHLNFPIGRRE